MGFGGSAVYVAQRRDVIFTIAGKNKVTQDTSFSR